MKKDLTQLTEEQAYNVIFIHNPKEWLLSNNYLLYAEQLSKLFELTNKQWQYLELTFARKEDILSPKTELKKLYLTSGTYVEVTTFENDHQRSIKVWENDFVNYGVSKGRKAAEQYLFLGDTTENMRIWDVKIAIEIYDHFEQHWNYLTK